VSSIDGAISAAGLSRGLQTPGDNRVFAALRDLADVVLVGAGTATVEKYRPAALSAERVALREELGLDAALPVAVVSGRLRIDADAALYADPSTLIFTTERADLTPTRHIAAEVVVCGREQVDVGSAVAALRARGLRRIVCEGGPTLFASMVDAGLVDEVCVSVSPILAGPGAGRLSAGADWERARRVRLSGLLEEDGALFARYRLNETVDAPEPSDTSQTAQ
jgi:5-amino-6-(5-phosphoribosylamino)uracil reductase